MQRIKNRRAPDKKTNSLPPFRKPSDDELRSIVGGSYRVIGAGGDL